MKDFIKKFSFSLCELNCVLCSMKIDGHCPGCGGGDGNQGCSIAWCSIAHGGFAYCSECAGYPCPKNNGITHFDSFITHRNQRSDTAKTTRLDSDTYRAALEQKSQMLKYLLSNFNDGRKKTSFCFAVNLLDLPDIEYAAAQISERITEEMTLTEKAAVTVACFEAVAKAKDIVLKMNKKPSKAK